MPANNGAKLMILVVIIVLLMAGCGDTATPVVSGEHSMSDADMQHGSGAMTHEHAEVPHEFEDLTNPFSDNDEALAAGQVIFDTNCTVCHGPQGKGDGQGAAGLNPKPADLSDSQMMGGLTDGYLFWRVSEGGQMAPFNSAMPAWKTILSDEQRWQVITYVRSFSAGMSENTGQGEHHQEENSGNGHQEDQQH